MTMVSEGRAVMRAMGAAFAALPGIRCGKDGPAPSGGVDKQGERAAYNSASGEPLFLRLRGAA